MKFLLSCLLLTFCAASLKTEPSESLAEMKASLQTAIDAGDLEAFRLSLDLPLLRNLDDPESVKNMLQYILQPVVFNQEANVPKAYEYAKILLENPETSTDYVLAIGFQAFLNGTYQPEPQILLEMVQTAHPHELLRALQGCEEGSQVEEQLIETMQALEIKVVIDHSFLIDQSLFFDPAYQQLLSDNQLDAHSIYLFINRVFFMHLENYLELCLRAIVPRHLTLRHFAHKMSRKGRRLLTVEEGNAHAQKILLLLSELDSRLRADFMQNLFKLRFGQDESLDNLEAYVQFFKDCHADNVAAFNDFNLPLSDALLFFLQDGIAGPNISRMIRGRLLSLFETTQIGLALAWLAAVDGEISEMPAELQMLARLLPYLNDLPISQTQSMLGRIDRTGASKDSFFSTD